MKLTPEQEARGRAMLDSERTWPGPGVTVQHTPYAAIVRPKQDGEWQHPWQIEMEYEPASGTTPGEWRATINPGFVNGRPPFIEMPAQWIGSQVATGAARERDFGINPLTGQPYFSAWVFRHGQPGSKPGGRIGGPGGPVRITNSPAPYLVLDAWRDPVASAGVRATANGELRRAAGEGYPPFFATVGVKPAAQGGAVNGVERTDASRTRELRAMDIVLIQPRLGSRLDYTAGNPIGTVAVQEISTAYVSDYVTLQEGRAKLRATAKYAPPGDDSIQAIFGTLLDGGDPQFDDLHLATVWMVSPANASPDAVPDATWEPYVQNHRGGFWNLNHAPRAIPPQTGETPIVFILPLALGTAQGIVNGIISTLNGMLNEALAFLRRAGDARGRFWNI